MDRLELYYANPNPQQRRGDYIRVRNLYVRSTRSFSRTPAESDSSKALKRDTKGLCRELDLVDKLRQLRQVGSDGNPAAGGARRAASGAGRLGGGGGAGGGASSAAADYARAAGGGALPAALAGDLAGGSAADIARANAAAVRARRHAKEKSRWPRWARKLIAWLVALVLVTVCAAGVVAMCPSLRSTVHEAWYVCRSTLIPGSSPLTGRRTN